MSDTLNKKRNLKLSDLSKSKLLIFDFDGVIVDSEKIYFKYWNEAALFYGIKLSSSELLSLRSACKEVASGVFSDSDKYNIVRNKRRELVANHLEKQKFELKPNIRDVFKYLCDNGYSIVIASSSSYEMVTMHLDYYDLNKYVKEVLSVKNVKRGKPYPDIYLEVCKHYDVKPCDVLAFEDSPNGVRSAYTAGVNVVMIPDLSKPTLEETKMATLIIDDIKEIINYGE